MSIKKYFLAKTNALLRKIIFRTHRMEMNLDFSDKHPQPAFFNHYYDLYYQWKLNANFFWLERGIFNSFFINTGAVLLELCCGDGFNTKYFYSQRASKILAVDMDLTAIAHATLNNSCANIEYRVADIITEFPDGTYDNIIMDAAIEQLSTAEQNNLVAGIKAHLKQGGIFSGLTIQKKEGTSYLSHNKHEFDSKDSLNVFLSGHFKHTGIISNTHNEKTYLYFVASDHNRKNL